MSLPRKPDVYRSIEGLIQHFEVMMPNRGFPVPVARSLRAPPNRPTANWAFTSSPTGHQSRIAPARGRLRTFTSRCSRISSVGHQLSDVVAMLGSLNIIAAELDR